MRIVPYPNFQHAGSLTGFSASKDPRERLFAESQVDVDLRGCQFVRPAAVLWCVIYPLLAKQGGSNCSLLVPENFGICMYLKCLGLFRILQESGIEVDDRDIPERSDPQIVLPLTRIESEFGADQLTNQAIEHAESPVGAFGLIQFYESEFGRRFVCGVADGGIGIRKSLEKNPELRDRVPYDWVAIELAAKERISSTPGKTRGIGLYGVAEDMRSPGRQLIIHSGIGSLQISEDMQSQARRTKLFPGTLAYASITT